MTIHRTTTCVILLSALALSATTAAQAAPYFVTDLGVVGAENTLGWGINARGQVTGYAGTPDDETSTGFVWNPTIPNSPNGTMYTLGTLGGSFSWGIGINASGQVAGLSATTDDEAEHAALWNPTTPNGSTGTLHDLGTLGGTYSQGTGINNSGQLTGYADLTGGEVSHAIMWKPSMPNGAAGTMHDLGTLGGTYSFGWDINAVGQVTGEADLTEDITRAFLWKPNVANGTSGTMHDLGSLGGSWGAGGGINDNGQVAGSSFTVDEASHAFLWTPTTPGGTSGTMLDLGTLGGTESYGYAVSAGGHVVGASAVPPSISNYYHAFLYTSDAGMVDLNTLIDPLLGWELLDADDINSAGQITGQGLINDEYHAFLLTPVPIPGDFSGNGVVDAADYIVWRKTGGSQDDYTAWQENFGRTLVAGSGSGTTADLTSSAPIVPEPAALTMLVLTALVAFHVYGLRISLVAASSRTPAKNHC